MTLRKLSLALAAATALAAIFAGGAMASEPGFWYKGGTKLTASQSVTCSNGAEKLVLQTFPFKTPLKFEMTGFSCPGFKIFNEGGVAKASGRFRFTGVTIAEPAGCKVAGGVIETEAFTAQVRMEGTKAILDFDPPHPPFDEKTGERLGDTRLSELIIEGCALSNEYPLVVNHQTGIQGSFGGEFVNGTNSTSTSQELAFKDELGFGNATEAAVLSGHVILKLTGGGEWKVNET